MVAAGSGALGMLLGALLGNAEPPLHAALVCPTASDCSAEARVALFDTWSHSAIRRPSSSFEVWVLEAGSQPSRTFVACVPERWGPGVMAAKNAFLQETRRRVSSGVPSSPGSCRPPAGAQGGVTIAGGRAPTLELRTAAHHAAVICDRSNSMLGIACDAARLGEAFDEWILRSSALPGSTFVVHSVGHGRDESRQIFSASASETNSPGGRVAELLMAREGLERALAGAEQGSAIAEATSVAANSLKRAHGSKALLLLTDLRQVTPGVWNFERSAPDPGAFVAWLRRSGLAEPLDGIPVRVVGVHNRRAPGTGPFDGVLARRVEAAWTATFQAMGAAKFEIDDGAKAVSQARLLIDQR